MTRFLVLALFVLSLTLVPISQAQAPHAERAIGYLHERAPQLGLSATDVADVVIVDSYQSRHNGVSHVYVQQRLEGVPIHNAIASLSFLADGQPLHLAHRFVADLDSRASERQQALTATDAAHVAASYLGLEVEEAFMVEDELLDLENEVLLTPAGIAIEPVRAQLAYEYLENGQLRLAWIVGIYTLGGQHYWNMSVDAATGAILRQVDLVVHDHWGISEAHSVHTDAFLFSLDALRVPESSIVSASADPGATGSRYRVYAKPYESPTHAGDPFADLRALVINPSDPIASPLGWHSTGNQTFTITRGNNVHAYTDLSGNNLPDPGSEPDGGIGLVFDFDLDLNAGPETYRDAAVTNLFYWNNIIHDVIYHYGFDEPAGNFQANNFGNGGLGNDPVRAEAQDGGGTNNATFFTPPDGNPPRMQMFVWTGRPTIAVSEPAEIAGDYPGGAASFGPTFSLDGITGTVVAAVDGDGSTLLCNPVANAAEVSGNIALVDRGTCPFVDKVMHAQNAGAIGVLVANNTSGVITMGGTSSTVSIPSAMVSFSDGQSIRNSLSLGVVVTISAPPNRDSDFDNGVIIHEYAHGISIRLTGGPATSTCLTNQEQAGEGWSDWYGLMLTGANQDHRGIGTYLRFEPTTGRGIRPARYSTDMSINPFTYGNIGSLSVPHGVGFVFASMLWEMTQDLIAEYGYDDDPSHGTGGNNLALQLVTDGLKLQPCSPGFVDSRDAILAADVALTGGANQCLIWGAFARRGLGFSADQGSPTSTTDGIEAFDVPVACAAVGSDGDPDIESFELLPIYPNPAAGVATVRFTVPSTDAVRIEVFDLLGRRVAMLADDVYSAGAHELGWNTASVGSGSYIVRLQAGATQMTQRVTVIR